MMDYNAIAEKALLIANNPSLFPTFGDFDVEDIYNLLINLERDKEERDSLTDKLIDFNDEIVAITELDERETMDITVSGDNLFYANGILTKNSVGLPATCDMMFAVIQTDELRELGQYLVIQLKNRFSDIDKTKRFMVGVDKSRMKLYNVEESAQKDIMQDTPVFDNTRSGSDKPKFDRKNFDGFK